VVQLTVNLWQEVGLVNGARGTVVEIVYPTVPPAAPPAATPAQPAFVLVCFDDYPGPSFKDGAAFANVFANSPYTVTWSEGGGSGGGVNRHCSRVQLPLQLCWAVTIHKSQGKTLDKAVIDIGEKEFSAGLTFVAFSRLRHIMHLLLEPVDFTRLESIGSGIGMLARCNEDGKLQEMSDSMMDI